MAISAINLGNFFTNSNGTSVASGISSGLNTDSIITALTAAQTAQVSKLNDQVGVNNKQAAALDNLNQILTTLQAAIKPLSNPTSPDSTNNLFAVTSSNVTSNTTQAAANYLTATVASGTAAGSYSISDVTHIATTATEETNAFTLLTPDASVVPSTPAAGYFSAGDIMVKGQKVTINTGDSLGAIAQSFNNVSSATGIAASVLQTSAGNYKLIFTSTTTGDAANFDLSSSNTVTSDPSGVLSRITFQPDQTAYNASFKLNGVAVSRATNNINDLISGVTVNLLQNTVSTPGAAFTLTVAPDVTTIASGIANFANAYNNFLYFYSQQTALNADSTPADSAVLSSDDTLRNIYNSVTTTVSSLVSGLTSGQPDTLAAIGISFTDAAATTTTPATSNILSVDSSTLLSQLQTNFSGVEKVFGDGFSSSSSDLLLFHNANDLQGITGFSLQATQSASPPTYVASYTDPSGAAQTVNFTATTLASGGVSLQADSTSQLAGLSLIYTGSSDESITVSLTQGIVSKLQSKVDSSVKSSTGLIANDKTAILAKNTAVQTQITTINTQLTAQKNALLAKYSALEAAISKANSALNFLNAQQAAQSS